jgi:hypothetical protein
MASIAAKEHIGSRAHLAVGLGEPKIQYTAIRLYGSAAHIYRL